MVIRSNARPPFASLREAALGMLLVIPMAAAVGTACALFLRSLDKATALRWDHPWLLWTLPAIALLVSTMYHRFGAGSERGNNLLIDEIHEPGAGSDGGKDSRGSGDSGGGGGGASGGVPLRMAPLILIATVLTHLGGGSAGREGTAVQMGGSIAGGFTRLFRLRGKGAGVLLMAGVAAGFGGVFGTPLAGAVFAIEVLAIGKLHYRALAPCLVAAVVAHLVCVACGAHHTRYPALAAPPPISGEYLLLLLKVILASIAFGLVALFFAEFAHATHRVFEVVIRSYMLRAITGALLVIVLSMIVGEDYLGLGVNAPPGRPETVTILSAFTPGGAQAMSWWWKILFTAITLGCGLRGGEVTPLFFIGATLGNTLAWLMGAPVELFAALGFVAVFAGATNTPLACAVMGAELFGPHNALFLAVACFVAYFFSGHSGVYLSQRIHTPKRFTIHRATNGTSLRIHRATRPSLLAWLRRQRRLGMHFCPQCNYDLRGTPAHTAAPEPNATAEQAAESPTKTCPECGWKGAV